jgi:NitT/TauT family transport system substrate-binding protein
MKKADYTIERMKSWPLLRAYFMSGEVDLAYIVCPMAMDMFAERPNFRWVSLLHRDGNALAINDLLNADVKLPEERLKRKPDDKVARAYAKARNEMGRPSECGVPHLLSTHTVVLYKYLKDHGKGLDLGLGTDKDVVAIEVPPPKSPSFIKKQNSRGIPASFEQSLPWADVVETKRFGHVAWYSKDVMPWPNGHVECVAIATDNCVKNKREALQEVIHYIHKAGLDIEKARRQGGPAMMAISDMIRKHIPEHNQEAIIQSLRPDLNVINYRHLNVDKAGLKHIMDQAVEGGILKRPIDIDAFADESFSTKITEDEVASFSLNYSGSADRISEKTMKTLENHIQMIEKIAADPITVNAVKEHNAKGLTLDEIEAIDKEWVAGGREKLVSILQGNPAGRLLRNKVLSNREVFAEAFLCDRQGAVVGEYPKTSDYWQGDEKKFTACYNNGNGKVYTGPLEFDESTKTFSRKISVPVRDKEETIGVLIFGIINVR